MEVHQYQYPPGDPHLIEQIVNQIKSQGTFDQWRRECLSDVDTKPAYQNLTVRVDNAVASFLSKQYWRPDMIKNQVRENLRKNILELGFIEKGVDRIVEQVVQPKVLPLFRPAVESVIFSFLGIKKVEPCPKTEDVKEDEAFEMQNEMKKAFKPMPVSFPSQREDDTPPPGDDGFELEAITPSPDGPPGEDNSASIKGSCEDLHDDVSDVSMGDTRGDRDFQQAPEIKAEAGDLERICSPISQSSSASNGKDGVRQRPGSALSAISSGDELPSAASVLTSEEQAAATVCATHQDRASSGIDSDSSDEFSSPEFEKLDTVTDSVADLKIELDEEEKDKGEDDDHAEFRKQKEKHQSDRKPDDDHGRDIGPSDSVRDQQAKPPDACAAECKASDKSDSKPAGPTDKDQSVSESKSSKVSSKVSERETSKSDRSEKSGAHSSRSEKSERRDKSRSDRKHSERSDRDRSDKKSDRSRNRSDQARERDKSKKSHRSDRSRDRDRHHRRHSESERRKTESRSKKSDFDEREATSSSHPKAHLFKRPSQRPKLWEYLSKFPQEVFQDLYDGPLSDVSVSSVSSNDDSDFESLIHLSEIEVDSEIENTITILGGRIIHLLPPEEVDHDTTILAPEVSDNAHVATVDDAYGDGSTKETPGSDAKRVRKLNTRYNDSYVGSEWRKMESLIGKNPAANARRINNNSTKRKIDTEFHDSGVSGSSPEGDEYPESKKMKSSGSELPSSPESVQSNPQSTENIEAVAVVAREEAKDISPSTLSSRPCRRSIGAKLPQQRYDDTDLYKPRPVITPSTRRTRRNSQTTP